MYRRNFLMSLATVGLPVFAQTKRVAERPEFNVGDRWLYRRSDSMTGKELVQFDLQVVQLADDGSTFFSRAASRFPNGAAGDKPLQLVADKTWTFRNDRRVGEYRLFDFPLSVGKQWETKFVVTNEQGQEIPRHNWGEVEAEEQVTTQAGTFQTLRVLHTDRANVHMADGIFPNHALDTYWYASEVKFYVKRDLVIRGYKAQILRKEREELLSFQPGQQR
jgi:hypothetical protein